MSNTVCGLYIDKCVSGILDIDYRFVLFELICLYIIIYKSMTYVYGLLLNIKVGLLCVALEGGGNVY